MASPSILLTGATGGLGAEILKHLLSTSSPLPPSAIIATSRSAANAARFEDQGVQFRVADYDDRATLKAAFAGVHDVLFVSSPTRDTARRNVEHRNVVEAAKLARVGRVWYVSLAFGGWGDDSAIGVQQAHYETEKLLQESGLDFITLRAGSYADAFPLFINYYPSTKTVRLPELTPPVTESRIAFVSRDELAEGIAALLAKGLAAFPSIVPRTEKNIILLTGPKAESLVDLVGAINRGRGSEMDVEYLEPQEWTANSVKNDEGGKGTAFFEGWVVYMKGVTRGDAKLVDPALEVLLGRKPECGTETTERLVRANPGYTWHQNYVNKSA
nr:quinone oxidoreductase 2 [Quercus suber]